MLTNGTLSDSSAAVFLNGARLSQFSPTRLVNAGNVPGFAGGGLGPDLLINGIGSLNLDGNGNTGVAGTGDQAIVYAAGETDLTDGGSGNDDVFGLRELAFCNLASVLETRAIRLLRTMAPLPPPMSVGHWSPMKSQHDKLRAGGTRFGCSTAGADCRWRR